MSSYNSNLIKALDSLEKYSIESRNKKLEAENARLKELTQEMFEILLKQNAVDRKGMRSFTIAREIEKFLIKNNKIADTYSKF